MRLLLDLLKACLRLVFQVQVCLLRFLEIILTVEPFEEEAEQALSSLHPLPQPLFRFNGDQDKEEELAQQQLLLSQVVVEVRRRGLEIFAEPHSHSLKFLKKKKTMKMCLE
jgi:hypothetical protein